jgi:predicted porin
MRSSTYVALFAGSAAAQSSVTLFNLYPFGETLTQIGSDATATTYKNDCPSNNAGISILPPSLRTFEQDA